jgi:hypothetical protein
MVGSQWQSGKWSCSITLLGLLSVDELPNCAKARYEDGEQDETDDSAAYQRQPVVSPSPLLAVFDCLYRLWPRLHALHESDEQIFFVLDFLFVFSIDRDWLGATIIRENWLSCRVQECAGESQ